nr:AlpA family phage regulatory protein [Solimonas terrae]
MADIVRITGLSRATIYRRIGAGRFPAPVNLGGRACGWPSAALQTWIEAPDRYRAEGRAA